MQNSGPAKQIGRRAKADLRTQHLMLENSCRTERYRRPEERSVANDLATQ